MFHSISLRLQFCYGLLLLAVFVALGAAGFHLERTKMLKEVDDLIVSRTIRINSALARLERDGFEFSSGSAEIQGIPVLERQTQEDGSGRYYFVWKLRDDQSLVFRSTKAPPGVENPNQDESIPPTGLTRIREEFRERVGPARVNYTVLVGVNISKELKDLRSYLLRVVLIEISLFAAVLLIGYWIAQRALKPIEDITEAAHRIAQGNLDERIELGNSRSELGKLSLVLNDTFDKLEAGYRRQTQFTSDVSHELRTPISVILAEVQSGASSPGEYEESFDVCESAARAMRSLVEELLELARFDAGINQEVMELTPLAPLVEHCVDLIAPIASEKDIEIKTDIGDVSCKVEPGRIEQVVMNFLSNAVAYSGRDTEIKVSLQREGEDKVTICVSDTGIGISEGDLPHIFERFYRADSSRTGNGAHSGLGLAIAKKISDTHGGSIEVESSLGDGSTFTLSLKG